MQLFEHGFDFARFDPEASQLDLLVRATVEVDKSVTAIRGQVARAVEPFAGDERAIDEFLLREFRVVQVTTCQASTTDIQLTGHADRHRIQVRIQNMAASVGNGSAYADRGGGYFFANEISGIDRGFSGAVKID